MALHASAIVQVNRCANGIVSVEFGPDGPSGLSCIALWREVDDGYRALITKPHERIALSLLLHERDSERASSAVNRGLFLRVLVDRTAAGQ